MATHAISTVWPRPGDAARGLTRVGSAPVASRLGFRALLALVIVVLFAPQAWIPALAPLRPALLAVLVGLTAVVVERLKHGQRIIPAGREMALVAALAAWSVVTIPFSDWPGGSASVFVGSVANSFVVFWLITQTATTARRQWQLTWLLAILTVPPAEAGIEHYLRGIQMEGTDRVLGYRAGLMTNPNDLALALNLLLPMLLALFFVSRTTGRRVFLLGAIALSTAGIVVTFSRGGFITLAVAATVYLVKLYRQRRRGWAWLAVVAVLLMLPAVPPSYVQRITTMSDIEADPSGSAQERWRDLGAAAGYVAKHPIFGAGLGQSILALNEARGATWRLVHNMYLEYGVELGLPGLAIFVWLLWLAVRNATRARRLALDAGSARLFAIAEAVQVSLIAFAVAAFFHPGGYHFLFFLLAGQAVALRRICEEPLESSHVSV